MFYPFRHRENLMIHREEIDEDGFFHNMLTGLVFWGGAGIGKKDQDVSTGYASTCTLWDIRMGGQDVFFEEVLDFARW
ncbi:hypothetical protein EYZ11_002946 [Aspergillus tanneri]|nr:hypothetical protein EYZ11_002946 [Aspergillus tanneri]